MTDLSPAQWRVYDALVELTNDGWPATVREIQRTLGYASATMPHVHLHNLARLNLARQHPRNPCGGWLPAALEGCPNPYCRNGLVAYEPNESGGAPALDCYHPDCPHRAGS